MLLFSFIRSLWFICASVMIFLLATNFKSLFYQSLKFTDYKTFVHKCTDVVSWFHHYYMRIHKKNATETELILWQIINTHKKIEKHGCAEHHD